MIKETVCALMILFACACNRPPDCYVVVDDFTDDEVALIDAAAAEWNDGVSEVAGERVEAVRKGSRGEGCWEIHNISRETAKGIDGALYQETPHGGTAGGTIDYETGEIIIATDNIEKFDGARGYPYEAWFQSVLMHEFGHVLGLRDTFKEDGTAMGLSRTPVHPSPLELEEAWRSTTSGDYSNE